MCCLSCPVFTSTLPLLGQREKFWEGTYVSQIFKYTCVYGQYNQYKWGAARVLGAMLWSKTAPRLAH